jgi:hypothetical protein
LNGDDCYSNSFGNDCYSNSFGDGCVYNNFGEGVNTVAVLDYCQYNIFDSGVSFVDIKTNGSWTGSNYLQNIHIHQGVTGSSDAHKIITISRNNTFCTDVVSGNDVEVTA